MRMRMVAVLVGLIALGAACTSTTNGGAAPSTTAAQSSSSDTKPKKDTTGTTQRKADDPKPTETKRNKDAKPYTDTVKLAIDDIQDFWTQNMPDVFGQEYEVIPDSSIYAETEKKHDAPSCEHPGQPGDYEEVAGNAFFCRTGNFVAYDDQQLLPEMYEKYGEYAIAMVFAHEWGHAVQFQVGIFSKDFRNDPPTIITENQADCFAGAWTKHALENKTGGFRATAADLQSALAGWLDLADTPGGSASDPGAHGTGFDRINGFQTGFDEGAATCATFSTKEGQPKFLNLQFCEGLNLDDPEDKKICDEQLASGGNVSYDEAVKLATADLNAYWESIGKRNNFTFEAVDNVQTFSSDTEMPTCGGDKYSEDEALETAFFCVDDNYVAWDEPWLQDISVGIGDFGVATVLARQWATSFQVQEGQDKDTIESKIGRTQQSCFTGAWTRAVLDGDEHNLVTDSKTGKQVAAVVLTPGDIDEAIKAFLLSSETPDAKGKTTSGSAFDQVEAFRDGFLSENGEVVCDQYGQGDTGNSGSGSGSGKSGTSEKSTTTKKKSGTNA